MDWQIYEYNVKTLIHFKMLSGIATVERNLANTQKLKHRGFHLIREIPLLQ